MARYAIQKNTKLTGRAQTWGFYPETPEGVFFTAASRPCDGR